MSVVEIGDLTVKIDWKDIKNLHLSVHPPAGRVTVSAPAGMSEETIRVFLVQKIPWIRQQKKQLQEQQREAPREYINRESHYFMGKRYLLKVIEANQPAGIDLKHDTMVLLVRPGATEDKRREVLDEWYRGRLKESVPGIIDKWKGVIGEEPNEFGIKKMKTKWGTCNPEARRIWINLELAKKPPECLEYIVVHEMVHLIERSHNEKFVGLMSKFMPKWRFYRDELNRLPVSHADWHY